MKSKYVIDSSAWIEYYQGSEKALPIMELIEQEPIATSMLVIAELSDKFAREDEDFEHFLLFIQSRCAILPVTLQIATSSGKLKHEIRKRHKDFSLADAITLLTARATEAILVTGDKEFEGVDNVMII